MFPLAIVQQNTVRMVTRFGRFKRRLNPGLHVIIPFVDRMTDPISLKENTRQFDRQNAITKDGLTVSMALTLYTRVIDPVKYAFAVEDPPKAVAGIAQSLLRCEIGKLTLDEVLQQRQQLNQKLSDEMQTYGERWGVTCSRYEITKVDLDPSFGHFMNLEAESERERRKKRLEAQQIETTTMNEAQRKRVIVVNLRAVEAKKIYFHLTAWAVRVGVLRGFVEGSEGNWAILESKLKADLVNCYGQLATGDKQVFLRHDVTKVSKALDGLLDHKSANKRPK